MRQLIAISALVAMLVTLGIVSPQTAAADVECKKRNPRTGVCLIEVTVLPGEGDNRGDLRRGEARTTSASDSRPTGCTLEGHKMPCQYQGGTWSNSNNCYLQRVSVEPPKSDPAWEGHTTGNLYLCYLPEDGDAYTVWLATAPGAPPPPDPRVLAQQAVAAIEPPRRVARLYLVWTGSRRDRFL